MGREPFGGPPPQEGRDAAGDLIAELRKSAQAKAELEAVAARAREQGREGAMHRLLQLIVIRNKDRGRHE